MGWIDPFFTLNLFCDSLFFTYLLRIFVTQLPLFLTYNSESLKKPNQIIDNMPLQVGDQIPDVALFEGAPDGKVGLGELCAGKKAVVFGVPGAFTPGCSKTHLPGYVEKADQIKR